MRLRCSKHSDIRWRNSPGRRRYSSFQQPWLYRGSQESQRFKPKEKLKTLASGTGGNRTLFYFFQFQHYDHAFKFWVGVCLTPGPPVPAKSDPEDRGRVPQVSTQRIRPAPQPTCPKDPTNTRLRGTSNVSARPALPTGTTRYDARFHYLLEGTINCIPHVLGGTNPFSNLPPHLTEAGKIFTSKDLFSSCFELLNLQGSDWHTSQTVSRPRPYRKAISMVHPPETVKNFQWKMAVGFKCQNCATKFSNTPCLPRVCTWWFLNARHFLHITRVFSKRHETLFIINKKYFPALFNIVFLHKDHEERKITAINAVWKLEYKYAKSGQKNCLCAPALCNV